MSRRGCCTFLLHQVRWFGQSACRLGLVRACSACAAEGECPYGHCSTSFAGKELNTHSPLLCELLTQAKGTDVCSGDDY